MNHIDFIDLVNGSSIGRAATHQFLTLNLIGDLLGHGAYALGVHPDKLLPKRDHGWAGGANRQKDKK